LGTPAVCIVCPPARRAALMGSVWSKHCRARRGRGEAEVSTSISLGRSGQCLMSGEAEASVSCPRVGECD